MFDLQHPTFVSDLIDIKGFTRTDLAYATAATQSGVVGEGVFDVWSDQNCYLEVTTAAAALTTANGYLLRANNTISMALRGGEKFSVLMVTTAGTLSWHRVG